MNDFNKMQQIKRKFYALRNGVTSDTLRKAGSPFKIIFGLNLPQLSQIAREEGYNHELARRLWENSTTRESQLLAPMLIDPATVTPDDAFSLIENAVSTEIIDNLCHKLLRHTNEAFELALNLSGSQSEKARYAAMRLFWHQINAHTDTIEPIARKEAASGCRLTAGPANQIIEEIEFMKE